MLCLWDYPNSFFDNYRTGILRPTLWLYCGALWLSSISFQVIAVPAWPKCGAYSQTRHCQLCSGVSFVLSSFQPVLLLSCGLGHGHSGVCAAEQALFWCLGLASTEISCLVFGSSNIHIYIYIYLPLGIVRALTLTRWSGFHSRWWPSEKETDTVRFEIFNHWKRRTDFENHFHSPSPISWSCLCLGNWVKEDVRSASPHWCWHTYAG